jgi:hypothetical protein
LAFGGNLGFHSKTILPTFRGRGNVGLSVARNWEIPRVNF